MPNRTLAYAASLIDSQGQLAVTASTASLRLCTDRRDRAEFMLQEFGGTIRQTKPDTHIWEVLGDEAIKLLRQIGPYLMNPSKADQYLRLADRPVARAA